MYLGVCQCKGIHFTEEWVGLLQISHFLDDGFDSLVKLSLVVFKQSVIYKTCATDGLVYQDSLFLVRQKSVFERTSHIVTAFGFFGYTLNIGYFIEIIKKTKIRYAIHPPPKGRGLLAKFIKDGSNTKFLDFVYLSFTVIIISLSLYFSSIIEAGSE